MHDDLLASPGTEVVDGKVYATVTISYRGFNEQLWVGSDAFATEEEAAARARRDAARILAEPETTKKRLLRQFA